MHSGGLGAWVGAGGCPGTMGPPGQSCTLGAAAAFRLLDPRFPMEDQEIWGCEPLWSPSSRRSKHWDLGSRGGWHGADAAGQVPAASCCSSFRWKDEKPSVKAEFLEVSRKAGCRGRLCRFGHVQRTQASCASPVAAPGPPPSCCRRGILPGKAAEAPLGGPVCDHCILGTIARSFLPCAGSCIVPSPLLSSTPPGAPHTLGK